MLTALIAYFLIGCFIPYTASNQLDLHEKLDKGKSKVAVLPFTLNTEAKDNRVGFKNVDVKLTNMFTKTIWKKNKVRIAHNDKVMEAIAEVGITYGGLNPDMKDLDKKPNIKKLVELGELLECDIIFCSTIRENTFKYEGGILGTNLMAGNRIYTLGSQMMAVDVENGRALAFDYISNDLKVPTKFLSLTGKVSDEQLEEAEDKLLEKSGFALAYYAPMPDKRTDTGTLALKTGAALLNIFADTEFKVETYIRDETWKLYPEGYFMDNFGYSVNDFNEIKQL